MLRGQRSFRRHPAFPKAPLSRRTPKGRALCVVSWTLPSGLDEEEDEDAEEEEERMIPLPI
jgi:hypothetical protein